MTSSVVLPPFAVRVLFYGTLSKLFVLLLLTPLTLTSSRDSLGASAAESRGLYQDLVNRHPSTILALNHETRGTYPSPLSKLSWPLPNHSFNSVRHGWSMRVVPSNWLTFLVSYDVLPSAVQQLKAAGYNLVTLAQCLGVPAYQSVGAPQQRTVCTLTHSDPSSVTESESFFRMIGTANYMNDYCSLLLGCIWSIALWCCILHSFYIALLSACLYLRTLWTLLVWQYIPRSLLNWICCRYYTWGHCVAQRVRPRPSCSSSTILIYNQSQLKRHHRAILDAIEKVVE